MTWWYSNNGSSAPLIALASLALISATSQAGGGSVEDFAHAPRLALPIACDMARDCSIQKYVDRAPGPDRLDYHCGKLTTDGHDGVDFRLRRPWDMQRNIAVIAAAPGTVLRVRDSMRDISVRSPDAAIGDRLAGNGVVIDHGGGWETQYSHLKEGSVRVHPGDRVKAGDPLGAVGISGNAEFPHLHFELRHAGKSIDPFAPAQSTGCGNSRGNLWLPQTNDALQYKETIALAADFALSANAAMNAYQHTNRNRIMINPDQLLIWGVTSGSKSGDVERFEIYAPKRGLILRRETGISQGTLQRVAFAGLKKPHNGWVPGLYRGSYTLIRNGKVLDSVENTIAIETSQSH